MPFQTLSQDLIVIEIPGKWHFKGNFYGYLTVESAKDLGLLGLPRSYYLFQPDHQTHIIISATL